MWLEQEARASTPPLQATHNQQHAEKQHASAGECRKLAVLVWKSKGSQIAGKQQSSAREQQHMWCVLQQWLFVCKPPQQQHTGHLNNVHMQH
jgi:hypothetical protein